MLRSDLCDYSDACIVVKGRITIEGINTPNERNKNLIFKNNNKFNENAKDLDIVIYILLLYCYYCYYLVLLYCCIIRYNIVIIIQLYQQVCGIIIYANENDYNYTINKQKDNNKSIFGL